MKRIAVIVVGLVLCHAVEAIIFSTADIKEVIADHSVFLQPTVLQAVQAYLAQERLSNEDRTELSNLVLQHCWEHVVVRDTLQAAIKDDLYGDFVHQEVVKNSLLGQKGFSVSVAGGLALGLGALITKQVFHNEKHAQTLMYMSYTLLYFSSVEMFYTLFVSDSKMREFEDNLQFLSKSIADNEQLPTQVESQSVIALADVAHSSSNSTLANTQPRFESDHSLARE